MTSRDVDNAERERNDIPFVQDEISSEDRAAAAKRREDWIQQYEQTYGMSSEEFLKLWADDAIEETFETNHWAMLLNRS